MKRLISELANLEAPCVLVFWHLPPLRSAGHGVRRRRRTRRRRLRRRQADARRVLDTARGLRAADEGLRQDGRRQGVSFDESYGGSGEQSRAVEQGLPADVVAFSLAPDVDRLVESGQVAETWADDQYNGMVTNSVVFAVRKGTRRASRPGTTWSRTSR